MSSGLMVCIVHRNITYYKLRNIIPLFKVSNMIDVPLFLYLQEFVENSSKALEALKKRKYADKNQIQPQEKDGMGDSTTTIPDIA